MSPGVWLQIGLDGAQRPALRAMTPIRGIAYRAVFAAPVWQDRVNLSVASQHRLTQMQRLSAQPDHPNPVRRGCARPPGYMRSLLAWPRGVGLRRLSADHAPWGDWWLTRPTASGFMGMMPQSKGNWERKNPMRIARCNADSHCCPHAHADGLACITPATTPASLHGIAPSQAYFPAPSAERHSDSACGRRPCMAPRPESPKKGAQRRKTNAVVNRKRASPHVCAVDHRHRCPPAALSDGHQQHALHPATSQVGGAQDV